MRVWAAYIARPANGPKVVIKVFKLEGFAQKEVDKVGELNNHFPGDWPHFLMRPRALCRGCPLGTQVREGIPGVRKDPQSGIANDGVAVNDVGLVVADLCDNADLTYWHSAKGELDKGGLEPALVNRWRCDITVGFIRALF